MLSAFLVRSGTDKLAHFVQTHADWGCGGSALGSLLGLSQRPLYACCQAHAARYCRFDPGATMMPPIPVHSVSKQISASADLFGREEPDGRTESQRESRLRAKPGCGSPGRCFASTSGTKPHPKPTPSEDGALGWRVRSVHDAEVRDVRVQGAVHGRRRRAALIADVPC